MQVGRDSQILVLQPFSDYASVSSNDDSKIRGLISEIIQDERGDLGGDQDLKSEDLVASTSYVPWHISNKYYDADVTFRLSNVSLFDSTTQKRPIRTPRKARMVTSHEDVGTTKNVSLDDDDEELKKRVRNVFEALEKPGSISKPRLAADALEEPKRAQLLEELEGVDAVMMVVDPSQPLRQHQRLLAMLKSPDEDTALLSGFDLAVSIVVAMSSPLEEAFHSTGQTPTMEQLSDLYTGEGWEFVDLDEHTEETDECSIEEDSDEEEGHLDDEELHGIPRIREALQTHTWPNLVRKNDRSTRSHSNHEEPASSAREPGDPMEDELDIESALAHLRMDLGSLDAAIEAEPTKQDEELAAAFLKRVLAAQSSHLTQEENVDPPLHSLASMQAELENFLESEDTQWPVAIANPSEDKEAWSTNELATGSISAAPAFDDDFTDFVQGSGTAEEEAASTLSPLLPDAFDTELDLDDLALMNALEREQKGRLGQGNGISFETTLSAVMAQAERVRCINDPQKRREEAAKVALTLSGEH